eukprot:1558441-Rhodomonas_salina.2
MDADHTGWTIMITMQGLWSSVTRPEGKTWRSVRVFQRAFAFVGCTLTCIAAWAFNKCHRIENTHRETLKAYSRAHNFVSESYSPSEHALTGQVNQSDRGSVFCTEPQSRDVLPGLKTRECRQPEAHQLETSPSKLERHYSLFFTVTPRRSESRSFNCSTFWLIVSQSLDRCVPNSSPNTTKSAGPLRELIERTTFKCWQKGRFTWQKFTKSSETPLLELGDENHGQFPCLLVAYKGAPQNKTQENAFLAQTVLRVCVRAIDFAVSSAHRKRANTHRKNCIQN